MTQHTLLVTLDGPEIKETGVLAEDFERVLTGVRTAMRLLVEHLGGRTPGPGQPPAWVRDQSRLRLAPTRAGSFIAELSHEPPTNAQLPFENQGQAAMAALCDWDGSEGSTLPISVTGCLYELAGDLSNDTQLWLGTAVKPRRVAVRRPDSQGHLVGEAEEALLQGWLKEVNWHRGTAQLHSDSGDYVRLRFDTSLAEEMQRLVHSKGRLANCSGKATG